jgi:ribosome biogenesis SPOUT family RNA methylase Rps3
LADKKTKMAIYIIEHLEPELWEWCLLEYEHISETVGSENLWFTNIKNKKDAEKLKKLGKVSEQALVELNLEKNQMCILDPESEKVLEPGDNKKFKYFVFGGILGDYPPRKRTKEELTSKFEGIEARNIGKEQMSTDNAVFTVKQIVEGKRIDELKFQDNINIEINEFESVNLPYRYNLVNGKPFMPEKVLEAIREGRELK